MVQHSAAAVSKVWAGQVYELTGFTANLKPTEQPHKHKNNDISVCNKTNSSCLNTSQRWCTVPIVRLLVCTVAFEIRLQNVCK